MGAGTSSERVEALTAEEVLRRAIAVADALAGLHRRGVAHQGVEPAAIVAQAGGGVTLAPPGELDAESRALRRPGAAAYLAPEQLRRRGLPVDHRADLYALGAVLYAWSTGAPPFHAEDLLGWTHKHLAQPPRPPLELDPQIPPVLSDIIVKLLAKPPEERYQSARGLKADLERCLEGLRRGAPERFPLGARDVPEQFKPPQRLYGRREEVAALLEAVERVIAGRGPALVLVRGYSGVGKSALVQEIARPVARQGGFFISGKFDQYRRDVPHATIVQAFTELARQALAAREERLAAWQARLRDELGAQAQLVADLVPATAPLVGEGPPAPPLPTSEAQNRFHRVMRQFVGVFAQASHPLAIFLDDLQWADAASVRLLQVLLTHADARHVLVICAYRDNELDAAHPWTGALEELRRAEVPITEIALGPLDADDVAALIADAFRCDRAQAAGLAELVHAKTSGNPYFVAQFLAALAAERLIRFDADAGAWTWSAAQIVAKGPTENIVELLLAKLRRLPDATWRALAVAACLGTSAATPVLAMALGRDEEAVLADLAPALSAGLLAGAGGRVEFTHDRVQQAAYSLLPADERPALHLKIGRHLRGAPGSEVSSESLFEVVSHLNAGAARIEDPAERLDLAALDLAAGLRAKQATAYAAARAYFAEGCALLPADAWERHDRLALALHRERAECAFLCMRNDEADAMFAVALAHARGAAERAEVLAIRVFAYYATSRMRESVDAGVAALRELGVDIPEGAAARGAAIGEALQRLTPRLEQIDVETLGRPRDAIDPGQAALVQLLVALMPSAYYIDIDLFALAIVRMVELSLAGAEGATSVIAYASFALLLVTGGEHHALANRLGRAMLARADALGDPLLKTKVYTLYGWFSGPWYEPVPRVVEVLQSAYRTSLECGDLNYGAFAMLGIDTYALARAPTLDELAETWRRHERSFVEMQHAIAAQTVPVVLDAIARLQEPPAREDAAFFADALGDAMNSAVGTYWVLKLQRHLIFAEWGEAVAAGEGFERAKSGGLLGTLYLAEGAYYRALAAAGAWSGADAEERARCEEVLRGGVAEARSIAARCPENFAGRAALLAAELARVEGRATLALRGYEAAIADARAQGVAVDEALACEAAARHAEAEGLSLAARTYRAEARAVYARWGARAKLLRLDAAHPELAPPEPRATPEPGSSIDVQAAVRASQAVSEEILLDRLLSTLMHLAIAHAGAERGSFLRLGPEGLVVVARAEVGASGTDVVLDAEAPAGLAEAVVQYARRTREPVILADAAAESGFAGDPYIARERPRSVLALPVVRKGELVAVLYLENNCMTGAFTPDRLGVLELIMAQAAISLENAALYADLERENAERRQAEQTLRDSEDRLRRLVESASVIPWEADAAVRRFSYVGPQAAEVVGHPTEAWLEREGFLLEICHPDDREALAQHLAGSAARQDGLEFRVVTPRGEVVWLQSILSRGAQARGFLFDCTERKLAEQELREKLAIIAAQREAIRTLSTPIIQVWDGVLTMPILGVLDAERTAQMQETLLEAIVRTRARFAILELTGVAELDAEAADQVLRLVRAIELLGARAVVVGIRPEVAHSLVDLGVGLGRLTTRANLRDALLLCMRVAAAPARR